MKFGQVVVFVVLVTTLVSGRFKTDEELEKEVCNSQVHGSIARVAIKAPPTSPIDIIVVKEPANKYEITCIKIFDDGPTLLPSQSDLCQEKPILSLCKSSVDNQSSTSVDGWECEDISSPYLDSPRSSRTLGGFDQPEFYYKLTWTPVSMGPVCFPRDLTVQYVGTELHKVESNLGAVIAFIIIACLVGVMVLFFATYQLRKQLRKFWKRELMTARRMPDEAVETSTTGVDMYSEDVVVPCGQHQTTTVEGVLLTSKPLPKKWYERYNYDERQDSVPAPQQVMAPESIERTPNATHSMSPMRTITAYDDPEPYGSNQQPDGDWCRMCSDCRIIIDENAPKLCHMTGLRHY